MKYQHYFYCPQCERVSTFVDDLRKKKGATLEASCDCGIKNHLWYKSTKQVQVEVRN